MTEKSLDLTEVRKDIKQVFEKYSIQLEDFDLDVHEPSQIMTFTIRGIANL